MKYRLRRGVPLNHRVHGSSPCALTISWPLKSSDHPAIATMWGPMMGPIVAIIFFVRSVGKIPLAAVPWNGISFGPWVGSCSGSI